VTVPSVHHMYNKAHIRAFDLSFHSSPGTAACTEQTWFGFLHSSYIPWQKLILCNWVSQPARSLRAPLYLYNHPNLNQTSDQLESLRKLCGRQWEAHGRNRYIHHFCWKSWWDDIGDPGIYESIILKLKLQKWVVRMWNVLASVQWLAFVVTVII
jgi:hypothetical protein